jgi:hypothetical protein
MADHVSLEYRQSLRRLSGGEKLRTSFSLYWEARRLKAARLREQHPGWSDARIEERVKEIFMYAVT